MAQIVAPILLWLWFTVLGVRRGTAIVVAVAATIVIWFAFYRLLRVPLPWGILTPYTGAVMSILP